MNLYGYWFWVFYTFFMPLLFDSIFDSEGWQLPDIQSLHLYRTHKICFLNSTESPTLRLSFPYLNATNHHLFYKPDFCKPQHRHPSLKKSPGPKWHVQVTPLAKPAPLLPSWKWRTKRLPCCYSAKWTVQIFSKLKLPRLHHPVDRLLVNPYTEVYHPVDRWLANLDIVAAKHPLISHTTSKLFDWMDWMYKYSASKSHQPTCRMDEMILITNGGVAIHWFCKNLAKASQISGRFAPKNLNDCHCFPSIYLPCSWFKTHKWNLEWMNRNTF